MAPTYTLIVADKIDLCPLTGEGQLCVCCPLHGGAGGTALRVYIYIIHV
jgi:hypothetical protein